MWSSNFQKRTNGPSWRWIVVAVNSGTFRRKGQRHVGRSHVAQSIADVRTHRSSQLSKSYYQHNWIADDDFMLLLLEINVPDPALLFLRFSMSHPFKAANDKISVKSSLHMLIFQINFFSLSHWTLFFFRLLKLFN